MAVLDDPDLTGGLRALVQAQPPQPDRVPAVAARVRRVRRRRAALATAAAVVVAGVPAAVLTRTPEPAPAPAVVAAAAAPGLPQWPDRSRPERSELGDAAVREWRDRDDVPDPTPVQWLYRGLVPHEGGTAYVAVFLSGLGAVQQLVVAEGDPEAGPESWSWRFRVEAAATAGPPGTHLRGPEDDSESTLLVLADPAARELSWAVRPLPGSRGTGAPSAGSVPSPDGVFVTSVPPLDGRVEVVPSGPGLPATLPRLLGGGAEPPLVLPEELELPEGVETRSELFGQSDRQEDGTYELTGLTARTGWPTGAVAYATCYGEAPLVVALQGRRTTVPCDGGTHPAGTTGPAGAMHLVPRSEGLLSYRIALAPR